MKQKEALGVNKRCDMKLNKHNEQGHVDIGVTLAIWIILGGIAWLVFKSKGEPLAMWLSWPWWAKVVSIAGPIVILFGGNIFENTRKWPKV